MNRAPAGEKETASDPHRICRSLVASIPPDVHHILQTLGKRGHEVWLVGGALRDAFLGLFPKDWDVATTAAPSEVIPLFPHVVPLGIRHGTVQVRTAERAVEISSLDDAGPEAIVRDLGRRDFTLNAMALSYPEGRLLDPYRGRRDLLAGTLRGVQDPAARFREDPLRALRAGRLISVYGFHLEEGTYDALVKTAHGLRSVAPERIREEVYRLLMGDRVAEAMEILRKGGVWRVLLPEIDREEILEHAAAVTKFTPGRLRPRLAALLHGIGCQDCSVPIHVHGTARPPLCWSAGEQSAKQAEAVLMRWRASRRTIQDISHMVRHPLPPWAPQWTDGELRRWLATVGKDFLEDCLDVARAERLAAFSDRLHAPGEGRTAIDAFDALRLRIARLLHRNPPLTIRQLAITGEDVMRALDLDPGPLVGDLLRRLHEQVLEDPGRNTATTLFQILEREFDQLKQIKDPL